MTRTETDDKQMQENLKDKLDVLLWLNQEFDHYNMQYFNQYFSKHFRPSVSLTLTGKTYSRTKTMLLSLHLSSFETKQCNEYKVYLLTLMRNCMPVISSLIPTIKLQIVLCFWFPYISYRSGGENLFEY